jgi:hypothetical protein
MKKIKLIRNNKINLFIVLGLFSVTLFSSCEEIESLNSTEDIEPLASEVIGSYSGTLTNSITNQSTPAQLTVTMENDSLVSINCTTDDFDSTIVMQLYQNNDSIMLCDTGQNFYNEYGHDLDSSDYCTDDSGDWDDDDDNWNNDDDNWSGENNWTAWTNHMNTQHDPNDIHFGGFNIKDNSCNISFSINNGGESYFELFSGTKNN